MVAVADVRVYLDNLSDDRVGDNVVQKHLTLAQNKVNSEKSSSATQSIVDDAILAQAGYTVYLAYASKYERSAMLQPIASSAMTAQLKLYETAAIDALNRAKRGAPVYIPPVAQPATLAEQYDSGELDGEYY